MGSHQQALIAVPYVVAGGVGWNPSDKAAAVTLSNGNRTMSGNGAGFPGARAVSGRSSGVLYFEICTDSEFLTANGLDMYAGIADTAMSLTAQPIFGAPGGHWVAKRVGNTQFGTDLAGSIGGGQAVLSNGVNTLGFVATFSTQTLACYLNGTLYKSATWGGSSPTMYPFGNTTSPSAGNLVLGTSTGQFLQSIPGGASAWD